MNAGATSVGIVGAGHIASECHIPALVSLDEARIAWITDKNQDRARKVASAYGLNSVTSTELRDRGPCADIVLLAIPIPPRAEYFDWLSRESTAVFAEKPLANSAAEHEALIEAFGSRRLSVAFQRRTHATSRFMRQAIEEGYFGALREISIREGARITRSGDSTLFQYESVESGGGLIKNLGCHSLDLAIWLTKASNYIVLERSIQWDGGTDWHAEALIALQGREGDQEDCLLRWQLSWLEYQPNTITTKFDGCSLVSPVDPCASLTLRRNDGARVAEIDATSTGGAINSAQAFHLEWKEVIAGLNAEEPSLLSAETALLTSQIIDELLEK